MFMNTRIEYIVRLMTLISQDAYVSLEIAVFIAMFWSATYTSIQVPLIQFNRQKHTSCTL